MMLGTGLMTAAVVKRQGRSPMAIAGYSLLGIGALLIMTLPLVAGSVQPVLQDYLDLRNRALTQLRKPETRRLSVGLLLTPSGLQLGVGQRF